MQNDLKRYLSGYITISYRLLGFITAIILALLALLALTIFTTHNKVDSSNTITKQVYDPTPHPTPYPTRIMLPAEKCSIVSVDNSWDTHTCTHFIVQLPKGIYADYSPGYKEDSPYLSYSEFYNYDYTKAEGRPFGSVTDQGKQKFSITLYLSSKNLQTFVEDYKKYHAMANNSVTPFKINNYDAIKVNLSNTSDAQYFIQNSNKTVILHYGTIFGMNKALNESILSSLKFVETSDWTTLKTSNFTFKYPSEGWLVSEEKGQLGQFVTLKCSDCENYPYTAFSIEPLIYKSLNEYKASEFYTFFSDTQDTTIDGEPAVKGIIPWIKGGGYCCTQLIYFVVHNGTGYQIMYELPQHNIKKFSQLSNVTPDILSTLQFIERRESN